MKNLVVPRLEAEDIRVQVGKVLRGLGNPEPPLVMEDVFELLRLDRHYYSTRDDSAAREFVSRIVVAGKQLLARPTLLIDAIRKAQLSALWVPDRRRILIDEDSLPRLKHRWAEAHEVLHGITPWHGEFLYGDPEEHLNPSYREKLESEANYGAGQLLFLGDRFSSEANDLCMTLKSVFDLAKRFGNTNTSTLWRFVEETHADVPMVALVSANPNRPWEGLGQDGELVRYCIESRAFKERFSCLSELDLVEAVGGYCTGSRGGPLGKAEVILRDVNGEAHAFHFESFSIKHSVLTLAVHVRPQRTLVAVPAAL